MVCSHCGTENRPGRKFCKACGVGLSVTCGACGADNEPDDVFCGECGSSLATGAAPVQAETPVPRATEEPSSARAGTELRHVSVLFCDLVDFTPLSEARDPEEVRELLSGYFDLARGIIGRYGGVIEKFIGDAVMAVWGAPVATEDDAERAVRAALELVSSVAAYGDELELELQARVGVVTGGAATTETPELGMVIGDRVNTAARIQSAAPPGCCYVDDATKHATSSAIAYVDAGEHDLKGKASSLHLHQALRVVAGVGGALKSTGLEAPFVGRDRELRLVKDLFHASAHDRRPHLVSVTGIAGIGKSRLAWEFYKYMDGLSDIFTWHRGRCLSYGEGVTYWALAEMVRSRAEILEGEEDASAAAKLRMCVETYVPDHEERRWIEPRLAHLLGIEGHSARDKEDLFAAWRLFFERIADVQPVVMSFEDMQWADSALLDFVEYVLDWSRNHPIFVLTLSRPELVERRPSWGAGRRNFTSIYLEPLSDDAMRQLAEGLVPGLPDDVRERILDRAEGVPLYAVETVRMLIDRGLLVREGDVYRPTGPIGALDIPDTLHALIAARLDGLSPEERGLLQDAAVLGKTFSKDTLASLQGAAHEATHELLDALVRKDILVLLADPRSSDRGQYSFLQDLVRAVAYESLSKRDRKERHLAVAALLIDASDGDEDEMVEVVASHYLDAYRLAPDAHDATDVRARARNALARAGDRASALAASAAAQAYFEQALELVDDPADQAELAERAGIAAAAEIRNDEARGHFESAITALESIGATHAVARIAARLGEIDYVEGHLVEGIARMESAFSRLVHEEPDENLATLAAQLGRLHLFSGAREAAGERLEFALTLAERLQLPETLSQALNSKAVLLDFLGRHEEAMCLIRHALKVALEHDLASSALRAYGNLCAFLASADKLEESNAVTLEAMELARLVGDRNFDVWFMLGRLYNLVTVGEWDEALQLVAEIRQSPVLGTNFGSILLVVLPIYVYRGDLGAARALYESIAEADNTTELQSRSGIAWARAFLLRSEGDLVGALSASQEACEFIDELGTGAVKYGLVERIECAIEVDRELAERLVVQLEQLPPGNSTPFLRANAARFRARLSPEEADRSAGTAITIFRERSYPLWLGLALLESAERLSATVGREADARSASDEARAVLEKLGAVRLLDRLEMLDPSSMAEDVSA